MQNNPVDACVSQYDCNQVGGYVEKDKIAGYKVEQVGEAPGLMELGENYPQLKVINRRYYQEHKCGH